MIFTNQYLIEISSYCYICFKSFHSPLSLSQSTFQMGSGEIILFFTYIHSFNSLHQLLISSAFFNNYYKLQIFKEKYSSFQHNTRIVRKVNSPTCLRISLARVNELWQCKVIQSYTYLSCSMLASSHFWYFVCVYNEEDNLATC